MNVAPGSRSGRNWGQSHARLPAQRPVLSGPYSTRQKQTKPGTATNRQNQLGLICEEINEKSTQIDSR